MLQNERLRKRNGTVGGKKPEERKVQPFSVGKASRGNTKLKQQISAAKGAAAK